MIQFSFDYKDSLVTGSHLQGSRDSRSGKCYVMCKNNKTFLVELARNVSAYILNNFHFFM